MSSFTRTLLTLVTAFVTLAPAAAGAQTLLTGQDPGAPSPWAIRASASATFLDAATFGIDVSRAYERWGLELELGQAWLSDRSRAIDFTALGRFGGVGGRHNVSIGLGPRVLAADTYGVVVAAQSELAYEFRDHGGVSFLGGVGPLLVLNGSDPGSCPVLSPDGRFCRAKYGPGDINLRFRIALGFSF